MWICKHCEMQNEDWENECYLCGKPQKEPDPVVVKEEKKETPPDRVSPEPAYRNEHPASHNAVSDFEFHIDSNETYEEYDPLEDMYVSDVAGGAEVAPDYSSFTEVVAEDEDIDYGKPDYARFVDVITDSSEKEEIVPDYAQFRDALFLQTPPVKTDAGQNRSVQKNSVDADPTHNLQVKGGSYVPFEYTDGEEVKPSDWAKKDDSANKPFSSQPAQRSPFVVDAPPIPPVSSAPAIRPVTEEEKKTSDFNLQQFLSQIKQMESDNITEEIRRKQEERKNQGASAQSDPQEKSEKTKAHKRAAKKEINTRRRQESVAMFSKVTAKISRIIIAVFLLLAAAFLGVCIWHGHGENVPYVIDEIFYMFELQFRGFLESLQLGF